LNSQFGTVFQEKVSLPGRTPNHLKFRILERGNAVLKPGLKISFGLFISAGYKRSQNIPIITILTRQQLAHTSDQITENVDISSILVGIRL